MDRLAQLEAKAKEANESARALLSWLAYRKREVAAGAPYLETPHPISKRVNDAALSLQIACTPQTVAALVAIVRAADAMREDLRQHQLHDYDVPYDAARAQLEQSP